jgi:hypothetical protein
MRGPWGRGAGLGAGILGDWEGQEKREKSQKQMQISGKVLEKKRGRKVQLIGQRGERKDAGGQPGRKDGNWKKGEHSNQEW